VHRRFQIVLTIDYSSDRYIILANIGTSEAIVDFSKFFGDGDIETEVVIFTPNAAEALQEK
jgi:hypothetical protein